MKIGVIILTKTPENKSQQSMKRIIHNNRGGASWGLPRQFRVRDLVIPSLRSGHPFFDDSLILRLLLQSTSFSHETLKPGKRLLLADHKKVYVIQRIYLPRGCWLYQMIVCLTLWCRRQWKENINILFLSHCWNNKLQVMCKANIK